MGSKIINWNVDPVIFWIMDTFPIKYYGLLFAAGITVGYLIMKRIYKNENVPLQNLEVLSGYVILGTILGARLGHCFFYQPDYYFNNPIEILLPIQKINGAYEFTGFMGLASHGGVIGVLIAIFLYCRKHKVRLLWLLDRIVIASSVTAAFIRFGNFMNSEIYGKPTNGSWGVVFQRDDVDLIPRHPTQLYEAFSYLTIFAILFFLFKSKTNNKTEGLIFGYFLVMLFSARLGIEFFKENQVSFENSMVLNMGQILSLPFIIAGIILIVLKLKMIQINK
ncbi:Prolipoprotein diacylglyceryl transferase [Flavobacterium sp. 9AF]|uniref:prolipoprotein diacylglyceryl transferase n=1 Tax=Flavobacterium sp. 9AF TaxID=2653142 RepID=UPI0012F2B12B|nr:prolipoprotein diacylglyceryl transferase [Flavobacterium sp. 9AF]VXC05697.1 Prolipoprotein diacylglyceryl transferase [Flavobacterium sp. 9AF]